MAMISAAQLLDELMGRDRNLAPNDKRKELKWEDTEVCKCFLSGFCPNELFINTRADLGPCTKIHGEALKKEYEKSSRYKRMGYEDDFLRFLQGMQSDVERRIRRGKQRLSLNSSQGDQLNNPNPSKNEEKISLLTEKIIALLEQVERLGCEGKVEEAQGMMKLCEKLKDERDNLQQTAEIAAAQEKQMEVCEVCGAFLIVGDAQQRVDDHLMGKQHVGYAKIRSTIEEILNKRQRERDDRDRERDKEREDRRRKRDIDDKPKDRDRDDNRKRHNDERDKDRRKSTNHSSRSSEKRRKSRSKSRDRKSHRTPSRDRSSRRRSRSKSLQSHSQDKKRSRSTEKRKDDEKRGKDEEKRSKDEEKRSKDEEKRGKDDEKRSKDRDRRESRDKKDKDRDRKKEESHDKEKRSKEETGTDNNRSGSPKVAAQETLSEGDTHSEH